MVQMRDGEILKKAYEQAEKFGFQWDGKYESFDKEDGTYMVSENAWRVFPVEVMLFSTEFAKAFWGKQVGIVENGKFTLDDQSSLERWQLYLKELVLIEKREDKIKYLQQFLK